MLLTMAKPLEQVRVRGRGGRRGLIGAESIALRVFPSYD